MTIEKVIDVLNEKKLCMIIEEIPFGNVDNDAKELYVSLGVAAFILGRYFRCVSLDMLLERYEKEWEKALKENSVRLPFSEGDDDVYDL